MTVRCPECKTLLSATQINAATDIAHCQNCNTIHRLSELVTLELQDAKRVMPEETTIITEQLGAGTIRINSGVRGFRASDFRFLPVLVFPLVLLTQFGFDKSLLITFLAIVLLFAFIQAQISNWVETQEFEISKTGLIYRRTGWLSQTEKVYEFKEITGVAIEPYEDPAFGFITQTALTMRMGKKQEPVPVLKTHARDIYFFDFVSKAEQEWIVQLLKQEMLKAKSAAGRI